jgi:hypothetical protein
VNQLDTAPLVEIALEQIDVGPRIREELKLLPTFRLSVQERGLIHPIMVRPSATEGRFELIAGAARLEMFRQLGRPTIPARVVAVDDERLLDLEVDENVARVPLSQRERSDSRRQQIARQWAASRMVEPAPERKKPGTKKADAAKPSTREAAKVTGTPKSTAHEDRQYIEACERYAFLKAPDAIPASVAVALAKKLDTLDDEARPALVALIEHEIEPGRGRYTVAVDALIAKSPEEQRRIAKLYQGDGETEHGVAVALATARPLAPDACGAAIEAALVTLGRFSYELGQAIREAPQPMFEQLRGALLESRSILAREREKWTRIAEQSKAAHREQQREMTAAVAAG